MATQTSFVPKELAAEKLVVSDFSHGGVSPQKERLKLEGDFMHLLQETEIFDRQQVSFQANKRALIHNWIKYKEGFSAQLVEKLISQFKLQPGDSILEPFSGSGTTLLVAKTKGINAIGFEILPNCQLMWEAKRRAFSYSLRELKWLRQMVEETVPQEAEGVFPHLEITKDAFPKRTEAEIVFFSNFIDGLMISEESRILMKLIIASILEEISYTRKDGQYLRWDSRSAKLNERNKIRKSQGKKPISGMDKGEIPTFKDTFLARFDEIYRDISTLQGGKRLNSRQKLIPKSVLYGLPELDDNSFDAVITSPPYCNRYDYTRSYALELAYLGMSDEQVKTLRQELLSCTVENKLKANSLRDFYYSIDRSNWYDRIYDLIESDPTLNEINIALQTRWDNGDINNKGILRMVKGYFVDLGFVIGEIYRTCKKGAYVAIVNDNVRYGGEIIPVDLLSTSLAAKVGFKPLLVYVLPQRKGNSSQQMKKFGREPLRKSITIWRK